MVVKEFKKTLNKTIIHFPLILGASIMLLPFIWMLSTSLKTPGQIMSWPPVFIPSPVVFDHYLQVFRRAPFLKYFANSLIISMTSTISILGTSSIAGFVFAKYEFPGKSAVFMLILSTVMIPFQSLMIPLYLTMTRLGLVDSYLGIVAPMLIMSFGIFLMRQYIMSIPNDLLEAARIDGCGEFGLYLRIILPSIKPALSALGIMAFMVAWGEFIWPLIITNSPDKYVIELGLANLKNAFFINYGLIMAGSSLAIFPVIIVFLFLRKHIIESTIMTGLKN